MPVSPKYCLFIIAFSIELFSCDPPNKYFDPEFVKLSATLNDSSETLIASLVKNPGINQADIFSIFLNHNAQCM